MERDELQPRYTRAQAGLVLLLLEQQRRTLQNPCVEAKIGSWAQWGAS